MTGDLPAAALRLMSALPSRTHEWQPKRREHDKEYIPNGRRVQIGARIYASLTDAAQRLRLSRHSIRRMVYANKARYVA